MSSSSGSGVSTGREVGATGGQVAGAGGEITQTVSGQLQCVFIAVGEQIDQPGGVGVQRRAAQGLGRGLFAGRDLEDGWAADAHGLAFDLNDDVGHRRCPGRAAVALTHDECQQGDAPVARRLVDAINHARHAVRAHDVGDTGAAGVTQVNHRIALALRVGHERHLLAHPDATARAGQDRHVIGAHRYGTVADLAVAADFAVGRGAVPGLGQVAAGQQAQFVETVGFQQAGDAFAGRQAALLMLARDPVGATHGQRIGLSCFECVQAMRIGRGHLNPGAEGLIASACLVYCGVFNQLPEFSGRHGLGE